MKNQKSNHARDARSGDAAGPFHCDGGNISGVFIFKEADMSENSFIEMMEMHEEKEKKLEKEKKELEAPEEFGRILQGPGHNVNLTEETVTDSTVSPNDSQEQDAKRTVPMVKVETITTIDYEIDLRRVLSDYEDERDEIWGKIYDAGKSEMVWTSQSGDYHNRQNGWWLECLFVTPKGNWFLYSEASEYSARHLYCKEKGKRITPLDRFESFDYLEARQVPVEIFEKHFADKVVEE
jgi:hypothetical protein